MAPLLRADDYLAVLDVVRSVARVDDVAGFPSQAVEGLGRLVDYDIASYNEVDPRPPRLVSYVEPEHRRFPPEVEEAWARLSHQHPVLQHMLASGDGSAYKISDFLDRDAYHRLALYADVYRDLGVEYQIAMALPAPQPLVVAFALSRERHDFSERDRAVLNLLRPHFMQAHRAAEVRGQLRASLDTLARVLGERGWGALLVKPGPTLEALTPASEQWLGTYLRDDAWVAWLAAQHDAHRCADALRLAAPLVRVREGRRLILRWFAGSDGVDVVLMSERPVEATPAPLRGLGLTDREAQVLFEVTRGTANAAIAARLGVAPATVKTHLERIYHKLGVSNRTEAAARALEALADVAPRLA